MKIFATISLVVTAIANMTLSKGMYAQHSQWLLATGLALLLFLSFWSLTRLLDGKKNAFYMEAIRLALFIATAIYLTPKLVYAS